MPYTRSCGTQDLLLRPRKGLSQPRSGHAMEEPDLGLEGATPMLLPTPENIDEHFGRGPGSKATREVFHNPAMNGSRTRSVLLMHRLFELGRLPKGTLRALDGLGASGIRARRWLNELPEEMAQRIDAHVCDILPKSLEWARQNQDRFDEEGTLTLIEGDLRAQVLNNGWHWIDVDPFGSPVTFLDPVIQAFARTGILEVSATDSAALTGSSKGPTMRRYGAVVRTNDWAHDSGLRVLLANIARIAARHDRAIEPLLSVWETHHLRVSVAIRRSKQGASDVEENIGWRVWDPTPEELRISIDAGLHPHGGPDQSQPFCFLPFRHPTSHAISDKDRRISGPMWMGPLHNSDVLLGFNEENALKLCVPDEEKLQRWGFDTSEHDDLIEASRKSVLRAIRHLQEEATVPDNASLILVDHLHPHVLLKGPPSPRKLAEALTEAGHPSCVAAYPNPGIRTAAPWSLIHDLALELTSSKV